MVIVKIVTLLMFIVLGITAFTADNFSRSTGARTRASAAS